MNSGYMYDGSFEGLLTCVYEAYYRHETPCFIISTLKYAKETEGTLFGLLEKPLFIATDQEKSQKVYNAILNKISHEALETIYHVYLSEISGFELMAMDYIKFGFKAGFNTNKYIYHEKVKNMLKAERKVVFEVHRMLGFIRFEKYNEFYYAAYEPDHNITSLIAPHFASRLSDQNFIIHDIKRETAAVYDKNSWFVMHLDKDAVKGCDKGIYKDLWKSYFKSACIGERENIKNQKRQMPKRYWKHLPEI